MSLQTDAGYLGGSNTAATPAEETKTADDDPANVVEFALHNDEMDNNSCSNGGTPSAHDLYESCQTISDAGGGYQEKIMSDIDQSDALSMSFRSVDFSGDHERRGSIEVKHQHEDLERLNKKRVQKMRQM